MSIQIILFSPHCTLCKANHSQCSASVPVSFSLIPWAWTYDWYTCTQCILHRAPPWAHFCHKLANALTLWKSRKVCPKPSGQAFWMFGTFFLSRTGIKFVKCFTRARFPKFFKIYPSPKVFYRSQARDSRHKFQVWLDGSLGPTYDYWLSVPLPCGQHMAHL